MASSAGSITIEQYRRFYAEEIRAVAHISDPRLVEAFARVPREKFLGPAPWQVSGEMFLQPTGSRETADARDVYHNVVVPLKRARNLNNGQPGALAGWIAAMDLAEGSRVFHVGCGTGYYTAIMAEMVGPAGLVLAAEVESDLASQAAENLAAYPNVTVRCGDGAAIDPGPSDAILINAGVTHPHTAWLDCLREGGRMILPLTMSMAPGLGKGLMVKVTRKQNGFAAEVVSMVAIYSSISVRDAGLEPVLLQAFESRELLKMKSIRRDLHEADGNCLVHASTVCISATAIEPAG